MIVDLLDIDTLDTKLLDESFKKLSVINSATLVVINDRNELINHVFWQVVL